MELTTTQMGAIAEAAIVYHATALGIVVLKPLIEGCRYDLVLDTGDRMLRTQCKWARRKRDVVAVRIRTSRTTPGGYVRGTYSAMEIDGVAAWCPDESATSFPSPISTARASSTCASRPLGTTRSFLYTGPRSTGSGL